MIDPSLNSYRDRVLAWVERIPLGKVATYGQIAALAGKPRAPRQVGQILAGIPDPDALPWQRVINSQGGISPRGDPLSSGRQRQLLEAEGVAFGPDVRVDFARFGWDGPDPEWLTEQGYTLLPWPGPRR